MEGVQKHSSFYETKLSYLNTGLKYHKTLLGKKNQ